jgi:hypothetical protein
MATLVVSTNYRGDDSERLTELVSDLSGRIALLTQLPEDELLIEFHVNTFLCFAGSTALSASCLWAFGGTVDKTANSELFSANSQVKPP